MIQIQMNLPQSEYNLFIEKGLIKRVNEIIKQLFKTKKVVIVTDKNVNYYYGNIVFRGLEDSGFEVNKIVLEPGELSKSIDVLQYIYNKFLDFSVNRDSIIIALGGGVVGDVTGFAASTFLRGVKYIQIPTSLLAQVDSSIGGKVAVNLERGKNLVGSFYHPKAVIIDPEVLNTLEDKFFNDGMAEVIKYGVIRDRTLFNKLSQYRDKKAAMEDMEYIISTCCLIKKDIVEKDEKDCGDRMLLNFGHTIGHAIENYYNYKKYSHGEAVAIGMYNISHIGEKLSLTKEGVSSAIKEVLNKYHLPYKLVDENIDVLIDTMKNDKKVFDDGLNFIIAKEIGFAYIKNIDIVDLNNYMNEI